MASSDPILVYGANGYSGRCAVDAFLASGLRPIVAGRDAGRLASVAAETGLEARVARLTDPGMLDGALRGVRVVVHTAGPFATTAMPMIAACCRTGAHYLDITGEVLLLERLAARHAAFRSAGVMVMPAAGFDVVPSDCLAAHVVRRLPGATRLRLGISDLGAMTPGTAKTLVESPGTGLVRRGGTLAPVPIGSRERQFDFGDGPRRCVNVNWGDLVTAWYTTGVPDIEVYAEETPQLAVALAAYRMLGWTLRLGAVEAVTNAAADVLATGPSADARATRRAAVVAEAEDRAGTRVAARLETPEVYRFTGLVVAALAGRVLTGDLEPGFQTPARVYGPDFVLSCPGIRRVDLA